MQFPRIHLNGSSAESLLADYRAAHTAVEDAITHLRRIDVNGRDYYTINSGASSIAMREHAERVAALVKVADDLTAIWLDIKRQHDERTASKRGTYPADWDLGGIRNLGNQPDDQ